ETVDVDFEFFDPKPIDFHGLKSLLRQTFANDSDLIPTSELADLIIAQPSVGTTVKVEDEHDPYALMTVIGFTEHAEKGSVKAVREYVLEKARKAGPGVADQVETLLPTAAWLVNERLINMPPQVVPPMLTMLMEEVEWAIEDGEPFKFDYFVYISKIYKEIESSLVEEDGVVVDEKVKGKKKKAKTAAAEPTIFYFQSEDEVFAEHAELTFDFKFTKSLQSSDSRRAFQEYGIDPLRRVFIIKQEKMKGLLKELEGVLNA
ncbi:p21-C-terminal region-binding protein-domain-containing protein, partial [Powellomyces hirtus]